MTSICSRLDVVEVHPVLDGTIEPPSCRRTIESALGKGRLTAPAVLSPRRLNGDGLLPVLEIGIRYSV